MERHICMSKDKAGMATGTLANIVGESRGHHTLWRLSNGKTVPKNQDGIMYNILPGTSATAEASSAQPVPVGSTNSTHAAAGREALARGAGRSEEV